jgi:hypothetical protein
VDIVCTIVSRVKFFRRAAYALILVSSFFSLFLMSSIVSASDSVQADNLSLCNAEKSDWLSKDSSLNTTVEGCTLVSAGNGNSNWTLLEYAAPGGSRYLANTLFWGPFPTDSIPSPSSVCSARPEIIYSTTGGTSIEADTSESNAGCDYAVNGTVSKTCLGTVGCTLTFVGTPTGGHSSDTPPAAADPVPSAPKLCGFGSCYDPTGNNYCAQSGGQTICVNANPSNATCVTQGNSTVCSGAPAPLPPKAAVPDPATQIASTDTYQHSTPGTAGSGSTYTTVNTYNTMGAGPNSGAGTSDVQPPAATPDPDAPKDNTSYAGGGDCSSPPVCSGDAAVCGAARTQWATTCEVHKDLTGDGAPSDFDALKTKYSQSDVWSDPDTSQSGTVGGQANAGIYDQSGFGFGNACPLHDIHVPIGSFGSFDIPLQDKCYVGQWIRMLVIGFALFSAAMITAGGKGSI